MNPLEARWAIVVPIKRLAVAKTRLADRGEVRADLALAMALDTVAAARGAGGVELVVVVTDEPMATQAVARMGAVVVADEPDAGLNPALEHGARAAAESNPGLRVAALSSDLPALRSAELDGVLAEAARHRRCLVADADGTGTTLLAAENVAAFTPRFGAASRQAHLDDGAYDVTAAAGPSVRRDVDTVDDLRAAAALGLGPKTAAALQRQALWVAPES